MTRSRAMRMQERVYRTLLHAFPKQHRDEYREPMTQLMRDRLRDEGGGARTVMVWLRLLGDLVRSAVAERRETAMNTVTTGWWRIAAALVALVIAGAAIAGIAEPGAGPWWQHAFGTAALVAAPIATLAGLLTWRRHPRNASVLIGLGVLPGCAAIVLFWHPLFLGFGVLSMAALCGAADEVDRIHRAARATPTVTK